MEILLYVMSDSDYGDSTVQYVVSDSGNWRSPWAGGDVPGRTTTGDQSSHSRPWPSTRRAVENRGWQVGVAPGEGGAGNRCTLEPQPVHLHSHTHSPPGEFYRERHPFIRQRTSHSFFHPLPGRDGVDRRQDLIWAATGGRSRVCSVAISRQTIWRNSSFVKMIWNK